MGRARAGTVLGFPDGETQARRLAQALGLPWTPVAVHVFPDGEHRLTLPPEPRGPAVIYRSLHQPNPKLVDLLLTATPLAEAGCLPRGLVAPYLCYMRQDTAFHPGEVVSQKVVGRFLAGLCEALVTVDPHLHRVHRLEEVLPGCRAVALSAAPLLGRLLGGFEPPPLVLGPDAESRQWVEAVAAPHGLDCAVAHKERRGDREVVVHLPDLSLKGRRVVLVDDVAASGQTLATAARAAYAAGAARVDCAVTHALFAPGAEAALREAGVARVWSTDSIPHPSNAVSLAPLLAEAVAPLLD